MKNFIILCFVAFMSQAVFAQQTAVTPARAAEKKSCCAPGAAKAGASCSSSGTAEANAAPAVATVAQTKGMVKKTAAAALISQTAQFQVWGNCGMCKKTIEKAAKSVAGVETAEWNVETHQFSVAFDSAKTSAEKVHQAIAASGYDTDQVRGNDTAYSNLHGCCQYERKQ